MNSSAEKHLHKQKRHKTGQAEITEHNGIKSVQPERNAGKAHQDIEEPETDKAENRPKKKENDFSRINAGTGARTSNPVFHTMYSLHAKGRAYCPPESLKRQLLIILGADEA